MGLPVKIRFLAIIIIVFLLCGVAAAQEDYYIRTDARINLRASYSLEAEKVETVEAGAVLHVVGRFNRWLKIDRNGQTVWMADWVYYTRVDDASPDQSTSQDQVDPGSFQVVDNCCQVDRQCHTEAEWTAGYYAFLNKHCSAPERFSEGGIIIEGSVVFAIQVEKALNLLKSRSSEWYAYVNGGLYKVREVPDTKITAVHVVDRIVDVTPGHAFLHNNANPQSAIIWLAGILVHEACHVYRFQAGHPYGTEFEKFKEEVICQQIQIDALDVVDPQRRFKNYLLGLIEDFFSRGYTLSN